MAKSTINMKRPIDSLANSSLFADRDSAMNKLATARYQTRHAFQLITNTTKRHHNHMILVPEHYITLVRPDLYSVIALYDSSVRPKSSLVPSTLSSHASTLYYMITHASHFLFASSSALRMAMAISAANAFSFFSSSSTPVHPVTPVKIPVSLAV
jgi:hypothetical protein